MTSCFFQHSTNNRSAKLSWTQGDQVVMITIGICKVNMSRRAVSAADTIYLLRYLYAKYMHVR